MIAFTVSLTPNDWDNARNGWRCPVLKIPGARVDALYAGGQIDDAWYKVDAGQEIVRWARSEDAPKAAALAVTLTKDLAPSFWKNLAIVVPIITALITTLGAYAVTKQWPNSSGDPSTKKPAVSSTIAAPYYERWTVTGRVLLGEPSVPNYYTVYSMVKPPEISFNPNGKFEADIPVLLKGDGDRQFPSLTFASYQPGYKQVTVELDDDRSGADGPGDSRGRAKDGSPSKESRASKDAAAKKADAGFVRPDFKLTTHPERRRIVIEAPITLERVPAYSSDRAAVEQRNRSAAEEGKK